MLRFQTAWWLSLVALRVICGIVNGRERLLSNYLRIVKMGIVSACEEPFYGNNCLGKYFTGRLDDR